MKPSQSYKSKTFSSPSNMIESFNSSMKSPQSAQIQTKRKEQAPDSSYGHISSIRTQLSLEKKKVQDLNKVVIDYQNLKQNSETKLNASLDDLRQYKDELLKSQKEIKNYEYKLEYLEKEKARLENQNKQLKAYITKLEQALKTAQQTRRSSNSPFNRTQNSVSNINQTFSHENFNSNNTNNNPPQNMSYQNLNVSNISQSNNATNPQLSQYIKKLEADVKNYQQEIKILTSALEINSPKVSIKRGLDQSIEQQHEKSLINLTKELAECKEIIQQNEDVESGLREKIQNLNQELEKAIIQIEEQRIIKENDNEEIFKLENENKKLQQQIKDLQQSNQVLQNQLNQSINQTTTLQQHQQQQQQQLLQQQLLLATDRLNTPKQSQVEQKLQSSFQQHQSLSQQSNDHRQHNTSSQHNQSHSTYDKHEAYDIIHKQKETIRELTEEISQIKAQLTEQNLNAYSDSQKWNKQVDELKSTIRVKEEGHQDLNQRINQLQYEIDQLKQKIEKSKEKKNKYKQEINILKSDQKQLESLNQKLNNKLKSVIEESSNFKDQIFNALKLNSKNYQVPRSVDAVLEEILYIRQENKQMKYALDESVNKYAQQVMLNKDLKIEIKQREQQIERQAESKTLVQSTLAQQIYNLRCQNTDLNEINSTIRRECTMFMDSLKEQKTKKSKRSKSLKKSKSTKSLKN